MFRLHNVEFSQLIRRGKCPRSFLPGLIVPLFRFSVFHQVHYQTIPCSSCPEYWLPHSRTQYTALTEQSCTSASRQYLSNFPMMLSRSYSTLICICITGYGPSHLCEYFPPFLACLRLFSNNTLSPTLTFVDDTCRQSKSRFCFPVPFLCFSQQLREFLL